MLQRKSGAVLELLLAGGSQRSPLGLTMIGAMPAVAVRHERRKRQKRPSQLGIASPPGTDSLDGLGSPDALQSPPQRQELGRQEYYICGKVSLLHVVVVSLLLGAILVIVGLVQLTPGADASQHRYMLLGGGGALLSIGILLAVLRCCVLPWRERRIPSGVNGTTSPPASQQGAAADASGSGSGSVRDGTRSRTNSASATNGQVNRRASTAGVCTPTGAQRRRSLMEAERGLPLHALHAVHASHASHAGHAAVLDDHAERRAEIDNHINEMSLAAPGELAATLPAALGPPGPPPESPGPTDTAGATDT